MDAKRAIKVLREVKENFILKGLELESFDTALSALEKQMPKKVVLYDLPTVDDIWLCPQCGSKMWGRHVSQTRFCAGCGQKFGVMNNEGNIYENPELLRTSS